MLVRIVAPHFVAGYDVETGNIAPIIKYMRSWSLDRIFKYCTTKGWHAEIFDDPNQALDIVQNV